MVLVRVPLIGIVLCLFTFSVRGNDIPAFLYQHEIDYNNARHYERNWSYLLRYISGLPYLLQEQGKNHLFQRMNLGSTNAEGLELLHRLCSGRVDESVPCMGMNEFRDLAYAFSKMNESWLGAIFGSWVDTSWYYLPFGAASYGLEIRKRGHTVWELVSPRITELVLKTKMRSIPESLKFFSRVGRYTVSLRTRRKIASLWKEHGVQAMAFVSGVKLFALITVAVYSAKAVADMALGHPGAFSHFIHRYGQGGDAFQHSTSARLGSWLYRFDNVESRFWESMPYRAETYFQSPLDMDLYLQLLAGLLEKVSPSVVSGQGKKPALKKHSLWLRYQHAGEEHLAEELDKKWLLLADEIESQQGCFLIAFDVKNSGVFPSSYLRLCKEQDHYFMRLPDDQKGYVVMKEGLYALLERFFLITHTERLILYSELPLLKPGL